MTGKRWRIWRWMWNGAVIVSLVMMLAVGGLWLESHVRMHSVTLWHPSADAAGRVVMRLPSSGYVVNSGRIEIHIEEYPHHTFSSMGRLVEQAPVWEYVRQTASPDEYFGTPPENCDITFLAAGYYSKEDMVFLRVPVWMPFTLFALLSTLWLIRRHRNRIPPNHCRACRYNLTGTLAAGRTECPECGAPIPPSITSP